MLLSDVNRTLSTDEVAGVAAGVAAALSDLHAAGRAHGEVDAAHVVLAGGTVTLRPADDHGAVAEDDVRALGRLIDTLLTAARPSSSGPARRHTPLRARVRSLIARVRRGRPGLLVVPPPEHALAEIARAASAEGAVPPSAASVAALIALRVPTARPPGGQPPPPALPPERAADRLPRRARRRAGRRSTTRRLLAGVPVVLVAASMPWALAATRHGRGHGADAAAPSPPAAPVWIDGVLTTSRGRYSLGGPGDVVLTGDWLCQGSLLPALLRPATGEVFLFDQWPGPHAGARGRAVGTVPGASRLEAAITDAECPSLAAVKDGEPVLLDVVGGAKP